MNPYPTLRLPLACLLVSAAGVPLAAQPVDSAASCPTDDATKAPPSVRGDRRCAVSKNFLVRSADPGHPADRVAAICERQRDALQRQWLGRTGGDWQQRCEVVIYADERSYLNQVGWQAAMTRGVCKIDRRNRRIVARRLSLMADPQSGELTALAHELTHVVLADRFPRRQPPRWADEGIALLADTGEKRSRHLRDLRRALADRGCPGVGEVLAMRQYPQGTQRNAFYGQSLSLVSYLAELDEPATVVDMLQLAMERGYDAALRETYGIAGTADLDRRWRRHLESHPRLAAR